MADASADTVELPAVPRVAPPRPGPGHPRRAQPRLRRPLVIAAGAAALLLLVGVIGFRLLSDRGQPGAWGGFENGRIPAERLCALDGQPGHRLRCDAAVSYGQMATAYRARFKTRLCITDSYRTYEEQVAAKKAKPGLAADPGTSKHGWGLAVDLCGGVNDFGTPQHRWVAANGPTYGWVHPRWAAKGKPQAEPWHFEFKA